MEGVSAQRPDGTWGPAEPLPWQDETLDYPRWVRRLMRVVIAVHDAWVGERRDWREGVKW